MRSARWEARRSLARDGITAIVERDFVGVNEIGRNFGASRALNVCPDSVI